MNFGPRTAILPVKVTAVEQIPDGATDVPQVGDKIGIYMPDTPANRAIFRGNCRVNLTRQRIAFPKNPNLDHWQSRFPNDLPGTNIGDGQEVKAASSNPAPAVNEFLAQQTAQLWVTSLLQGRLDQVLAISEVPFGWDKREMVKTAEERKAKLESVVKTKGNRNQQAGEASFQKDEEAAQAADRFKMLETAGLAYVLVKIPNPEKSRGFDPVLLAIKPGDQLRIVGFSD